MFWAHFPKFFNLCDLLVSRKKLSAAWVNKDRLDYISHAAVGVAKTETQQDALMIIFCERWKKGGARGGRGGGGGGKKKTLFFFLKKTSGWK